MIEKLRQIQEQAGANLDADGIPVSFPHENPKILQNGVALCDRSHWGLLKITGEERLRYLHNQSTNDFEKLHSGQGCDTVFVTSTARTLDLATAYVTEDAVLVLVSPQRRQQLFSWLDRFIFPFDKVELKDISDEYAVFDLIGECCDRILNQLGINQNIGQTYAQHQLIEVAEIPIRIAVGNSLDLPGYTLIVPVDDAPNLWTKLTTMDVTPTGDRLWQSWRIQQGRPFPDRELTEDYNPLEAGLWKTLSFNKGCYIGQETIARLNTYKGVKQRLWGVKSNQAIEPGTIITLDNDKVGILTSYTDTPEGGFGLAYIRTKAGGEGLQVQIGEASGELVPVPFIKHEYC
jgi:hypothetical protein